MALRYQLSAFFLLFVLSAPSFSQWHSFSYEAMTTPIDLVFWEEDTQKSEAISKEVFKEFDRIEQQMSRYIENSELSRINRLAFKESVIVSTSLFSVLNSAMNISKLSQGAFDITFASIGYLYDFRKKLTSQKETVKYFKKLQIKKTVGLLEVVVADSDE